MELVRLAPLQQAKLKILAEKYDIEESQALSRLIGIGFDVDSDLEKDWHYVKTFMSNGITRRWNWRLFMEKGIYR